MADNPIKEIQMAKFSKGDKVESVKTGARGVVDEVYGDEKYAVLFDGATNPDRVEGFQIKAANGCARNAKFKVGDKVTDGNAVYEITDVDDGIYEWKVVSGKADPSHSEGGVISWAESKMRLANSAPVRSANAVVQNAINARRARNAIDDAEGARRWDSLWRKVAELKREAEALDKYLVSKKQYGNSGALETLVKALTGF
jgi:hypothetical protein